MNGVCIEIHNINFSKTTVAQLKQRLSEEPRIPLRPQNMHLICGGRLLKDFPILSRYGIVNDATMHLICRLTGGALTGSERANRYHRRCERRGDLEPRCVTPDYATIKPIINRHVYRPQLVNNRSGYMHTGYV